MKVLLMLSALAAGVALSATPGLFLEQPLPPSAAVAAADSGRLYALLIGINQYADKADPAIADLSCTHADCELVRSLLPQLRGVAAAQTTLVELYDAQAVKPALLAALDGFAAAAGPQDTVLIYYSGHGALMPDFDGDEPAGDGALVLADFARENHPPTQAEVAAGTLTDDEMAAQLRRFARLRRVIYIADCCHSGGNERALDDLVDKGFDLPLTTAQQAAAGAKAVVPMPDANRLEQGNVLAIFASDSRRKAQEIRSAGHGAMTLCLSQICTTPADYDLDADGLLSANELGVGLRSLVDSTVRGYSGGSKYQISFVKALEGDGWRMAAGGSVTAGTAPREARGVAEPALQDVIRLVGERCQGRYDAGNEPYQLQSFEFLGEDGQPRADNVFLKRELYDARGEPAATLRFRFSLDAPAAVLALVVFSDGQNYLVYPNNPESVQANAASGVVSGGGVVESYPFSIPNPVNYGSDRFLFEFSQPAWEYIVLLCAPVKLDDPYSQSATAYDLLYPFSLLQDAAAAGGGAAADDGKGFGGTAGASGQPGSGPSAQREVVADGKRLTIFYQQYWLTE
jgi:hypothetical protein